MKKIDFHIHTVATFRDAYFDFSLEKLRQYVSHAKLDAIAITNHDIFDGDQFRIIKENLEIVVFPGIEVNLTNGHVLIISDLASLDDFESKAQLVANKITTVEDSVTVEELEKIFGDLNNYLVIPHFDKKPPVNGETLKSLSKYISAAEVDSAKKFVRITKNDSVSMTPVLFSDARISGNLQTFPVRQTYIDCGELTISAMKMCFQDKGKVSLSEADGNKLFQVFDNGQRISTGLNFLLGERSSGKTYTLDKIEETHEDEDEQVKFKYIRQFSLVQKDEEAYKKEFEENLSKSRSRIIDGYLFEFKSVLDEIMGIDLLVNEKCVGEYVNSLLKSAEEVDRQDAFSKTALFGESKFSKEETKVLQDLIGSVRQLIENLKYKDYIEKYVDRTALRKLAVELIGLLWKKELENKKRHFVDGIVKEIKQKLEKRSSVTQIVDVDLYSVFMDIKKVERFSEIVSNLQKESVILEESIRGFKVEARKGPFDGAGEIKAASKVKSAFSGAFSKYGNPYEYLQVLMKNEALNHSDLYKLFVKISYKILNDDGFEISGGERSEFRLLQEIMDAHSYDMLLIDEPESSFDNLFLRSDVNQIIGEISEKMPVVVVTHNSTVGASMDADYLLYAKKEYEDEGVIFRLYAGYPSDKELLSVDNKAIGNHQVMLDSLEAGEDSYNSRRQKYEAIKN